MAVLTGSLDQCRSVPVEQAPSVFSSRRDRGEFGVGGGQLLGSGDDSFCPLPVADGECGAHHPGCESRVADEQPPSGRKTVVDDRHDLEGAHWAVLRVGELGLHPGAVRRPERHRVGSKQRTVTLDMLRGRAKVTASQGDGSEHAQRARGQRVGSQLVGGGEAGRCGGCVETSGGELDLGAQDGGSGRLHAATGRLYLLGRTDDRVRLIEAAYVSEHLGQPEGQVGAAELAVRAGAEAATRSVDGIPHEIESGGQPPLVPSAEREDRLRRHEGRVIMSVGRRHDRFGTFTCPREVTERGEGPESNRLGGHFEPVDEIRICERNFDLGQRIRGPATRRESRRPEPRQRGGLLGEGGPGPCDSSPGPTVRQDRSWLVATRRLAARVSRSVDNTWSSGSPITSAKSRESSTRPELGATSLPYRA
jgi:hypothetical protein